MIIFNNIVKTLIKRRYKEIDQFLKHPLEAQDKIFQELIYKAKSTEFGQKHDFKFLKTKKEFCDSTPIFTYEEIYPYIQRVLQGESNVLWPGKPQYFSKSSGTTNDRSKFIPVTLESLEECHYKGGRDMLAFYFRNSPKSRLFTGKTLAIGGSIFQNHFNPDSVTYYGDVSAVIMKNLPFWAQFSRTPKLEVALMDEWESKIEKIAQLTSRQDITSLAGVPTWMIVLLRRVLEITGKENIMEVWPNLELFAHGAVAFHPYRELFKDLIPSSSMYYLEIYSASEGFFGLQDQANSEEMLLMLDYGIYYEFIPMDKFETDNPETLSLEEVEIGQNYAMLISTNAGLWRYLIGDTVRFTSLTPHRIQITGRTKQFINAFGEEVVVENAEVAITEASKCTGAIIDNFTAGPKYIQEAEKGAHEWVIEFKKKPNDLALFAKTLDEHLRKVNADYDAKRYANIALSAPVVHVMEEGTFYKWMKQRNKVGGQHKVPRLANNRVYLESLLSSFNPVLTC